MSERQRASRSTKRKKELPRAIELSLPGDVWRNVASHMDLWDWVRASGLCKTTWKLELDSVKVSDSRILGVEGARWMTSRWRRARSLSLSLRGTVKEGIPQALMTAQPCANELTQLQLEWIPEWDEAEDLTGLADIDLSSLIHLRSVCLMGLMPSTLALPPTTELHVITRQDWSSHPVWLSVLPMLRTITMAGIERLNKLPQILSLPSSLTTVLLSAGQVGGCPMQGLAYGRGKGNSGTRRFTSAPAHAGLA
ncbi:hypothetical protein WJX75_003999 [Coccomyxa subellipsoidea]|uniref:F-box domain-containing protein n=1 Tax=Coccomyxa subellipsoidea TaxID=248742 RepID=A0ABR2YF26_9CHLO